MKFSFGVLLQALLFIPLVGTRLPAQDSPVILRDRPIAPRFTESQVEAGTGLPTWHHRFTFKGTSYPYTMVGTDPAKGSETTIIPVYIIPLKFTFTDGEVFDSTAKMFDKEISATEAVIESPVFQSAPFHAGSVDVGTTQYVDAFQRANFWSSVSVNTGYHVLLGNPTVLPVQSFTVPKDYGFTIKGPVDGSRRAIIAQGFIDNKVTPVIFAKFPQITPSTFPIFLTYNVFPGGYYGYHDVYGSSPLTGIPYAYVSYLQPWVQLIDADISTLAHEVAEWLSDPYINNWTPCGYLEVGDPLSSTIFDVNLNGKVWHPQDLCMIGYFDQTPIPSVNGWLTFRNTLNKPCEDGS